MFEQKVGVPKIVVRLVCAALVALAAMCANPVRALAADEWVITDDAAYYIKSDDTLARSEWVYINGSWCWFGDDGAMACFWLSFGDEYFLFNADGTPYTGWTSYGGSWYFFDNFGRILTDEWVEWGGSWYYFDAYGRAKYDCWVSTAGYWFHLDTYGRAQTGWNYIGGSYYYFNEYGALVLDDWAPYNNVYYRIDNYGRVSTSVYPVELISKNVDTPQGTVVGYQLVPQGVRSAPLVVYSHGLGSLGVYFDDNAFELAGTGVSVYYFDFIGGSPSSTSGGSFTEMSVDTELSQLNAIVSAAKTWSGINTRKIFLAGHSQGGLLSTLEASGRTDIAGIILFSPALNLGEMLRSQYGSLDNIGSTFSFLGLTLGRTYAEALWDSYEYNVISGYSGSSLVFHGTSDAVIDPGVSYRAKLVWGDSCTLVTLSGAGHNAVLARNATIVSQMYNFIRSHESSSPTPWWPWGDWSWPWGSN